MASTKEVLDMFSENYADTCVQANNTVVDSASSQSQCGEFGSDPSQVAKANVVLHVSTLDSSSDSFNIRALL